MTDLIIKSYLSNKDKFDNLIKIHEEITNLNKNINSKDYEIYEMYKYLFKNFSTHSFNLKYPIIKITKEDGTQKEEREQQLNENDNYDILCIGTDGIALKKYYINNRINHASINDFIRLSKRLKYLVDNKYIDLKDYLKPKKIELFNKFFKDDLFDSNNKYIDREETTLLVNKTLLGLDETSNIKEVSLIYPYQERGVFYLYEDNQERTYQSVSVDTCITSLNDKLVAEQFYEEFLHLLIEYKNMKTNILSYKVKCLERLKNDFSDELFLKELGNAKDD